MTTNESGLNPGAVGGAYTDTGTGAYPGPPTEVVYGTEHDPNPTGLVEGPPASVTVESPPEHLSKPTGASPGPPASVTTRQHPAKKPAEVGPETKQITAGEVEDKSIKPSSETFLKGE